MSIGSVLGLAGVILTSPQTTHAQSIPLNCPDLTPLYVQSSQPDWTRGDWAALELQLTPLLSRCLQSTEYYALLGAAQLNTGKLARALESLERALLLNPDNGGAQIDYAQALYQQGQLFSALALNQQIINRQDLPGDLQTVLQQRQRDWQAMTRQTQVQGELLVGYDNNLNGAPSAGEITLTLSGDPIILPLNPDYQPKEGPYLNARLGARYRQLAPQHQHNVLVELRGRISDDKDSDLLQFDTRYAFIRPGQNHSWQAQAGISHLMFGGQPLYTAAEIGGRYMPEWQWQQCKPYTSAAAQHQLFHNQSVLNAIESKVSLGLNCTMASTWGAQQWTPEISMLNNNDIRGGRAGGSRLGWQMNLDWRLNLERGQLAAQLNHTQMDDSQGYNPLLANNAEREIRRSYVLLQYSQPMSASTQFQLNLYHQRQRSNLELFRSVDSTVELGINHRF